MLKDKVNIAVLVSGGGTNLQALIDAQGDVIKSGKIALVVSNKPDVFALTRAENASIASVVIKSKGKTQEEFETELVCTLKKHDIDMIVLAGFLSILTADFVKRYPNRIINVHPSLIPSFCGDGFYGLKVHRAALEKGVKVTGATVHYVNEITDGGKIILQKAVEVKENDTPETLQKRVMQEAEWILLPAATEIVAQNILKEN